VGRKEEGVVMKKETWRKARREGKERNRSGAGRWQGDEDKMTTKIKTKT
jgi:hypothetical protein